MRGVSSRRVGVAAIAYVCLLAQLCAFGHRALVRHVTCAEHGESVHVAAASESDAAAASMAGDRASTGAAGSSARLAEAPELVADEHDHCSVVLSRALTAQSPIETGPAPVPGGVGLDNPRAIAPDAGTATYLVAPKTSPPRRA